MDHHLQTATEEFVAERINYHRENESERLQKAYSSFYSKATQLQGSLTEEQAKIFTACEDNHSELDSEAIYYFYEAGFGDALRFIMGWGEGSLHKVKACKG